MDKNQDYRVTINLSAIRGCVVVNLPSINGQPAGKAVCLPLGADAIYCGEKGIYLDVMAWSLKAGSQYGNTHILKASLPQSATETDRQMNPIIGNLRPMDHSNDIAAVSLSDKDVII